jgi:hypothetical protein
MASAPSLLIDRRTVSREWGVNEEQPLHAQHGDPHCSVRTAMFTGVRRKVNDGNDFSGTFRVGMPKFPAPGSIFTTFGIGLPNAPNGNDIC